MKYFGSSDANKAHSCDEISVQMVKIFNYSLIEPLFHIFERSLPKGSNQSM